MTTDTDPSLPASVRENLLHFEVVATAACGVSGRGVLFVAYEGGDVRELHYIPEAHFDAFLPAVPSLAEAVEPVATYATAEEYVLYVLDLEAGAGACYLVETTGAAAA